VTERPILFSSPMVLALLEGRKTQTRRVVKPQPEMRSEFEGAYAFTGRLVAPGYKAVGLVYADTNMVRCPYGVPGDRLWVREALYLDFENGWCYHADRKHLDMRTEQAEDWELAVPADRYRYPSIHMPRWASRITLEVTAVRVERVQDITEADAVAEGFTGLAIEDENGRAWMPPQEHFLELFYGLNKRALRDQNPWVWVVEFRRVNP